MPMTLSRRSLLTIASATAGGALAGCASDPRFVKQKTAPENFRIGKAFVSLDVHEYANQIFAQGRQYDTVATFTNVGVGRNPMYFPADAWAHVSTPRRDPQQATMF